MNIKDFRDDTDDKEDEKYGDDEKLRSETGIPDFFVSTRVRFLIQTLNEKNLRPNEKRARLYEWTPISHAQ